MTIKFLAFSLIAFVSFQCAQAAVEIGKPAKAFSLTDTHGKIHSLADFKGKFVVLEWFNPDCPFVKKHYGSGNMQKLQKEFTAKGVIWLSINSSAGGKQGHYTPQEYNKLTEKNQSAPTALLLDHDGKVGQFYGAKTTPHLFIINPEGNVIYQGAIDSNSSADAADIPSSENYVSTALNAAMSGKPVATSSTKPYGCSVKY